MEMQLKDLVVFWTILLLKPSLLRQIGNDLEECILEHQLRQQIDQQPTHFSQ